MTDLQRARAILKKYGQRLPKRWTGAKPIFHVWHEPYLLWLLTYDEFIERVIEVEENKPDNQKRVRFKLMRPVRAKLSNLPLYADWEKADADWRKAYADWRKADADWRKAYADLQKADADFYSANKDFLTALHAKECGCKEWNGLEIIFR